MQWRENIYTFGEISPMPLRYATECIVSAAVTSVLAFSGCQSKKKPLTGDELTQVKDLIEFFPPAARSLQFGDTILRRKENDSSVISYKAFSRFVPDSVFSKIFGRGLKPKSYPLGRMQDNAKTNYLLVKAVAGDNRSLLLFCFDKHEKLVAAANVLKPDQLASTSQSVSIDRSFNISKNISRKNPDGSQSEGKEVFILNQDANSFALILTEQLDDRPAEFINPIDTLPRRQKFSADYGPGKTSLVSIRDGNKPGRLMFFIHFEKNKGECNGELKGEAVMTSTNTAVYREGGDPCVMEFIFSATAVTLKEMEGCAAHRGLRCSFDGSFIKRKPVKTKK